MAKITNARLRRIIREALEDDRESMPNMELDYKEQRFRGIIELAKRAGPDQAADAKAHNTNGTATLAQYVSALSKEFALLAEEMAESPKNGDAVYAYLPMIEQLASLEP
jgi:hypothetical protein